MVSIPRHIYCRTPCAWSSRAIILSVLQPRPSPIKCISNTFWSSWSVYSAKCLPISSRDITHGWTDMCRRRLRFPQQCVVQITSFWGVTSWRNIGLNRQRSTPHVVATRNTLCLRNLESHITSQVFLISTRFQNIPDLGVKSFMLYL